MSVKLKVIGGSLDVEFPEGSLINEAQKQLKKAADIHDETKRKSIKNAPPVSEPTKDGMGALNRKPKMPI